MEARQSGTETLTSDEGAGAVVVRREAEGRHEVPTLSEGTHETSTPRFHLFDFEGMGFVEILYKGEPHYVGTQVSAAVGLDESQIAQLVRTNPAEFDLGRTHVVLEGEELGVLKTLSSEVSEIAQLVGKHARSVLLLTRAGLTQALLHVRGEKGARFRVFARRMLGVLDVEGRVELPSAGPAKALTPTEDRLQRAEVRKRMKLESDLKMADAKRGKMLLDVIPRYLTGKTTEAATQTVVRKALELIAGESFPALAPQIEARSWNPEDLVTIGIAANTHRVGLAITDAKIRDDARYGIAELGTRNTGFGQCKRLRMNVEGLRLVVAALEARGWLDRYPTEILGEVEA
jgi:hypothetical protein